MSKEMKKEIMKNGKIMTISPSGEWWINGHITTIDGVEKARVNGFVFELKDLNIVKDHRNVERIKNV